MVFIKQCLKCKDNDKKMYCKECEKSIDYFEVFENLHDDNKNSIPTLIHTIKAYTWNDTIKFINMNYFKDQDDLIINGEKEFAYLIRQTKPDGLLTKPVDKSRSYKIYLKNENNLNLLENTSISIMIIDLTMYK